MTYGEVLENLTRHMLDADAHDEKYVNGIKAEVIRDALYFLLRKHQEIEKLNGIIEGQNKAIDYINKKRELNRQETIRDFEDKLGEHIEYHINENGDFVPYVSVRDIGKVANEMVR